VSILRDPSGPLSPLDICLCGERIYEHPTKLGCMEFQSIRFALNIQANAIAELVETLVLRTLAREPVT
jgi:hypothetical protein